VTSRGDNRSPIFFDYDDRQRWLDILALVCTRFNFNIYAYCQMGNHYHLMLETVEGNLSQGMRQLNAFYSQHFNRRHRRVGHVFQGRYKAILVQKESYLLELARYVVLNPVRGGLVNDPQDWRWGSYQSMIGRCDSPTWLDTEWLLGQFGRSPELARIRYQEFVIQGIGKSSPLKDTQHQLVLGDEAFVARHRCGLGTREFTAVVKNQRRLGAMELEEYEKAYSDRDEAMARAYATTAFSMVAIGHHFNVSEKTVSRAVRRFESQANN
jgi:REP element-mobilizing transposase RayT